MFHTYNNCYYGACGDGNCLYRACSKLLGGKEDHMCEKMHIYFGVRILHSLRVCQIVHWVMYDRKDPSSRKLVVQRETIRNAKSGTHASFVCLLALLSVTLYECLFSVPRKVGEGYIYSKFLNGTVLPRVSHNNIRDKLVQGCNLVLMWTTHGILSMPGMNENFQPNHFVPLVVFVANDNNQKKNKQQKITDLFKTKSVKQESN